MIQNFEEQTHELTNYELNEVLPLVISALKPKIGIANAITSFQAIKKLKQHPYNLKIAGPRWRKIINYIRINSLIPNLISTSKGYDIATKHSEISIYINSLDQRINAITRVRDCLQYQQNKFAV